LAGRSPTGRFSRPHLITEKLDNSFKKIKLFYSFHVNLKIAIPG
jgi:hypothetical protein